MIHDEALLTKLDNWRCDAPGPHRFFHDNPATGIDCSLSAECGDALSCRLTDAVIRCGPERPCAAAELTQRAMRVAKRVTGLLEPLAVYEIDATRAEALLRSTSPAIRGEHVFYYEVVLRGLHAATLRRWKAPKANAGRRETTPFVLTHEAITKLVADVTATED